MSTTVISGGQVLSPSGAVPADVLVDGELISGLAASGSELAQSWAAGADRVFDATGRYRMIGRSRIIGGSRIRG